MALTVAKKLNGVVMTLSPGPILNAASASQSASVPLAQPTAASTPQNAAAAPSKRSTSGPRMNRWLEQTASMAASTGPRMAANSR